MVETTSVFDMDFFSRFVINLISLLVLLRGIYYRNSTHKEVLSGFILFGNGVFFVTAILHDVEMSMGFAFGLFAIFSMLRYRTESLTIREMTYLFVLIAMALLAAVGTFPLTELAILDAFICFLAFVVESSILVRHVEEKNVLYEKIDLIQPAHRNALLTDLRQRLGYEVLRVEIGDVNFLRDTAQLRVYFDPEKPVKKEVKDNYESLVTPPVVFASMEK